MAKCRCGSTIGSQENVGHIGHKILVGLFLGPNNSKPHPSWDQTRIPFFKCQCRITYYIENTSTPFVLQVTRESRNLGIKVTTPMFELVDNLGVSPFETSGVQEMLKYFWCRRRKLPTRCHPSWCCDCLNPDTPDVVQNHIDWEKKTKMLAGPIWVIGSVVFQKVKSCQNLHQFFLGFFLVKHQYWRDPDF